MNQRKNIPKGLRFDVLTRDGFKCVYCGAHPPDVVLHMDHKIPVSKGGENTYDNLLTACQPCNIGKGAKDVDFSIRVSNGVPVPLYVPTERPRVEFFWRYNYSRKPTVEVARCIEWVADAHPYGGSEYRYFCDDLTLSTHGHSGRGFSPYEAEMYAVDILANDWARFEDYLGFIDDLNLAADKGLLPQSLAPHVLRALHAETIYRRCGEKPHDYEYIADKVAEQSAAAFRDYIDTFHTPWGDAR